MIPGDSLVPYTPSGSRPRRARRRTMSAPVHAPELGKNCDPCGRLGYGMTCDARTVTIPVHLDPKHLGDLELPLASAQEGFPLLDDRGLRHGGHLAAATRCGLPGVAPMAITSKRELP